MMEVLPPAHTVSKDGVSGFLVGEPTDHRDGVPTYGAYFTIHDMGESVMQPCYYLGDMTIAEFTKFVDDTIASEDIYAVFEDAETPDDVSKEYELREQYSNDAVDAYLALGFEQGDGLENFEDAYVGEYDNDIAFAQEMHEQTGMQLSDEYRMWPYTCIDWEQAAREIMYDYAEEGGYYFLDC